MPQQLINVSTPNDHTGDPIRTAFMKSNDNFTELYERVASEGKAFSVLVYGADNTGVNSSSTAINNCMTAAAAWSAAHLGMGATVYIPEGYYYITAGIQLKSYVHVKCEPGALFRFPNAYAGAMWMNAAGQTLVFATVTGGVYGQQGGTRTWTFIDLNASNSTTSFVMFCRFAEMTVFDCNIGVNFNVTLTGWINANTFRDIVLWRPIVGSKMRQASTGIGIDANFFDNFNVQILAGTSTIGFDWQCTRACLHNKVVKSSIWDITVAEMAIDTNGNYCYFDCMVIGVLPADMPTVINDTGYRNRIDYRGGRYSPVQYPWRYWGINADKADVDKIRIEAANDAGSAAAPGGDLALKLKSYQTTAYGTSSANGAVRILTRNQMSTNFGSWLILQTHGTASDPNNYLDSLTLKPSGGTRLLLAGCPVYANNAAAVAGGLVEGDLYRTNGDPDMLCIVH